MINTHGYTMIGLSEASAKSTDWPHNSGIVNIIRYDPSVGRVWTTEATEDHLPRREYVEYRTARHISAQAIADNIAELLDARGEL